VRLLRLADDDDVLELLAGSIFKVNCNDTEQLDTRIL
jgi:hypothetical protein